MKDELQMYQENPHFDIYEQVETNHDGGGPLTGPQKRLRDAAGARRAPLPRRAGGVRFQSFHRLS